MVPAALESVIHKDNVKNIRAKCIVELANGPVTNDADVYLESKGIHVVPDILANAGGVTVSYFEWVQNRAGYYWSEDEVHAKLKTIMTNSTKEVSVLSKEYKTSLRTAAYIAALRRINAAVAAKGTLRNFSASK